MEDKGISIYRLAKDAGLSEITVSKMVKNKGKGVRYSTLEKICEQLGCVPGDILDLESEEKQNDNKYQEFKKLN